MKTMQRLILTIIILALGANVRAHDSRPLFIAIEEMEGQIRLEWTTPPTVEAQQAPNILIEGCALVQAGRNGLNGRAVYRCEDGLSGKSVKIAYPLYNPSLSTIIRVNLINGEEHAALLDPAQTEWRIGDAENFGTVAGQYFKIGVDHIISGYDHLLFLAGLLYIARTPRRVLITVTGFTLAHSLTIFLVALNIIRVSVPAVETVVALSIVFLAAEIARNNRATLAWRRPILVSAGFGLVHGAGFAAALSEIGLPQVQTISALLFFNLGVEAGQLAVIAAVFAIIWALLRFANGVQTETNPLDRAPFRPAFAYSLGIVSGLWFIQRLSGALV